VYHDTGTNVFAWSTGQLSYIRYGDWLRCTVTNRRIDIYDIGGWSGTKTTTELDYLSTLYW